MDNELVQLLHKLGDVIEALRNAKPEERNEIARRFAVTITELEKIYAYFKVYVVDNDGR